MGREIGHEIRIRAWLALALSLMALAATIVALAILPQILPVAEASSGMSRIDFQPASGPVGTAVDMDITIFPPPDTQQDVVLGAEPWDAASACASAKPFPGVPPISMTNNASAHVIWPAAFSPGQYRVCALAASDGHMLSSSFYPFTVTDPSVPTPTSPPTSPATPIVAPTASVLGQIDAVLPGSDIAIKIVHWSPSTPAPVTVTLHGSLGRDGHPAPPDVAINRFSIGSPDLPDGSHGSQLTFTLPPDTQPGSYVVVITEKGGFVVATQPFTVVPTAMLGQPLGTQSHSLPAMPAPARGPTPLTLLVAAMLALAVLLLAGPALARRLRRQTE